MRSLNTFRQFIKQKSSFISFNFLRRTNKHLMIPSMMAVYSIYKFNSGNFINSNKLYSEEEYTLHELEGFNDLIDGEMKVFKYGQKDNESVLIVKYDGEFYAVGNSCPHFGAPMHQGFLIDSLIKCPWHGASFDIKTGKTEIAPSMDDLAKFELIKEKGKLYLKLPKNIKTTSVPKMSKRDPNDPRRYVIVGGGAAGLSAAETLRQLDFTGEILILTEDHYLPYDRTLLSKFFPKDITKLEIRSGNFLKDYDIDVKTETSVLQVDSKNKEVVLKDGTKISFDKLLVATGGKPILPPIPGIAKENVVTLRTFNDSKLLLDMASKAKNVVIIGGSFIGMEAASALKKTFKDLNITVVDIGKTPFERTLGVEIGQALQSLHQQNGIKFVMGSLVTEVKGDNDRASAVKLRNGEEIEADLILVGAGIEPNTGLLKDAVDLDKKYVRCDSYLGTTHEDIFAAGDITNFPFINTGERINFGHWVSAQQQGSIAASNMLGKEIKYAYMPFFWTRQWDKTLSYTGYSTVWDEVFIDGNLHELKFAAYYLLNDMVVGFCSMNLPNATNIVYEALRHDLLPRGSSLKNGSADLETIKKSLKNVKVKCQRATCRCSH